MSERLRCTCRSCTIHSLMGPVILITVGVLFLLEQMSHGWGHNHSFGRLWPVLLVVIGGMKLAESLASTEGHVS